MPWKLKVMDIGICKSYRACKSAPVNRASVTPTISKGFAFNSIMRPTTVASPPKRRRQRP